MSAPRRPRAARGRTARGAPAASRPAPPTGLRFRGSDIARHRLEQQGLVAPDCEEPGEVVERLLAMQSQDYAGARWAVAQRTLAADDAAVQAAFQSGKILRTHVLRPTWHFVSPADIRWLLALTAPRVHALNAYYYRQHGLDAAAFARANARLSRALAPGRHLTREELGRVLGEGGVAASGSRLAYLLMRAELDGLIVSGVMRGKQHTYALLEERAAPARVLERDEALALIARRYVAGHGPAQAQDLAWWSGLTLADAKRAFEASAERLEHATIDGKTYWWLPRAPFARRRTPRVHLLPNYDELLIAFKDRSAMLDPGITARTEELSAHVVVVDGRIVGGWRRTLGAREVFVSARLLRALAGSELEGLERAAARYAASLGLALRLEVVVS